MSTYVCFATPKDGMSHKPWSPSSIPLVTINTATALNAQYQPSQTPPHTSISRPSTPRSPPVTSANTSPGATRPSVPLTAPATSSNHGLATTTSNLPTQVRSAAFSNTAPVNATQTPPAIDNPFGPSTPTLAGTVSSTSQEISWSEYQVFIKRIINYMLIIVGGVLSYMAFSVALWTAAKDFREDCRSQSVRLPTFDRAL